MLPWEHEDVGAQGNEGWLTACCWLACQEKEELAPGILGKAQRAVKKQTISGPWVCVRPCGTWITNAKQDKISSLHMNNICSAWVPSVPRDTSALRVLEVISAVRTQWVLVSTHWRWQHTSSCFNPVCEPSSKLSQALMLWQPAFCLLHGGKRNEPLHQPSDRQVQCLVLIPNLSSEKTSQLGWLNSETFTCIGSCSLFSFR